MQNLVNVITQLGSGERLVLIVLVLSAAHLMVIVIRRVSAYWMQRFVGKKRRKAMSVISLLGSSLIFIFYFASIGFALNEIGVPITAYLASASIIGLAVGFGSQGLVQDVVSGLTSIFSDVYDVGDMVEIGGQIGVVRSIGLRFLEIENSFGARVVMPNRSISNVVNYQRGYVRCIVDVSLPKAVEDIDSKLILERIGLLATGVFEQFPGILLTPPVIEGEQTTSGGRRFLRVKFRIWPGRGGPIEQTFQKEVVQEMKKLDGNYQDWMVAVYYEVQDKAR